MNKTNIIVEGSFCEGYEAFFDEYSARVRRYLDRHGAEVIRRQRIKKTLYGESRPDLIMLIDLPCQELAETIFFQQEYLDILPLRNKVFKTFHMHMASMVEIECKQLGSLCPSLIQTDSTLLYP